jgi:pimeloyl-ACP methyl ester carboxylesterase
VPLDHDDPNGAAISIAVVRLAALDPVSRIGSLFFNPGGPGGSGVDFVLRVGPLLGGSVRARFDLVGFDPRGVARSTAVRCFGTARQWLDLNIPFAFPVTPEEEALWAAADQFVVSACDQRAGRIIDHMSTAAVARDLDLLREAVGDELLTYLGFSYGSYLGVTYANLFPDRFRAIAVDGVLDPVAWSTGAPGEAATLPFSTRLRSDAGAAATLDEFFRLCDAGGANCAFAGDAAARFAALAARLRAAPHVIVDPVSGEPLSFSYADLVATSLGAMYSSRSWPSFAQFLAYVEASAEPAVIGAQLMALHEELGFLTKRGIPNYLQIEDGPGVYCSDSDNPRLFDAWSTAAAASEAQFGYFARPWTWLSSWCVNWPGADADRYMGPFNTPTLHPVLVVGNQFDPATRYEGAVTVHNLMPNSSLLTVHAWGHTATFSLSGCATFFVTRYLVTGITPPAGTVCEQSFVPFPAPPGSPTSGLGFEDAVHRQVLRSLVPGLIRTFGQMRPTQ